jgi:excisionase family DNA binding protein
MFQRCVSHTQEILALLVVKEENNNPSEFLTVDEAARLVGLSHWTIRLWLHKGRLTRYKSASRTLVSSVELLELLKPRKVEHT